LQEVDFDSLEQDDEGRMLHQGHPFTGTAIELRPNGVLASRMDYVDGVQDGWVRGWHENGVLNEETFYREGGVFGITREWYANGQLKLEEEIEHGIRLWGKAWNESGELVKDYVLPEDHPNYQAVQKRREKERSKTQ
jgi:antitoxin component YwqK of YwqJK toxin-antitoxin module